MRIYPAIRAQMGDWNYYIVRMKMRDVAQEVQFAHDIYEDRTLSEAVQRVLNEKRVKKEIVGYLARRTDRFFSSIVVAAIDGEPIWHPVEMDTSVVPAIFTASASLRDSFGVLAFGDEPRYYALDGQHRVAAIKQLVNRDASVDTPANFDDDMLSVIVVLREEHDVPDGEWMRRYRRLFSSLNRYARKTGKDTNIIMDEDDLFAILTRRLITEHKFFQAPGPERDSFKVRTRFKNLRANAPHFTTLQTLYAMNKELLTTREREIRGWLPSGEDIDIQFRPEEDYIDERYEELSAYWDAILSVLPILRETPEKMRRHVLSVSGNDDYHDLLLFWPIGQELFIKLVRSMLDDAFMECGYGDRDAMAAAMISLKQISWELHDAPWRYLLLVPAKPPNEISWRMRNEDRKMALEVAGRLLRWMVGLDLHDQNGTEALRTDWRSLLYPEPPEEHQVEEMWQVVVDTRARIMTGT